MTESSRRPLARRLQARVMRLVNTPMRILLGLPVATPLSNRLMMAFIIGPETGKIYRQPLSYVKDGNTCWLLAVANGSSISETDTRCGFDCEDETCWHD